MPCVRKHPFANFLVPYTLSLFLEERVPFFSPWQALRSPPLSSGRRGDAQTRGPLRSQLGIPRCLPARKNKPNRTNTSLTDYTTRRIRPYCREAEGGTCVHILRVQRRISFCTSNQDRGPTVMPKRAHVIFAEGKEDWH